MMMIGSPILVSLSVLPSAETGKRDQGTGGRPRRSRSGVQVIGNTTGEKRIMYLRKHAIAGVFCRKCASHHFVFFGGASFGPFNSSFTSAQTDL
jgi:hypothetical protein